MEKYNQEVFESQVEEAVKIMESKGYEIGPHVGEIGPAGEGKQAIIFNYPRREPGTNYFDDATWAALRLIGITPSTSAAPVDMITLEFQPHTDDASEVKDQWMKLAEILPEVK